jgi:PAS domain S-box-containing protein
MEIPADFLQSINNNLPGAIFRYRLHPDGTDQMMYVSQGAKLLWGIDAQECMDNNQKVWEIFHPDDIGQVQKSIQKSAEELSPWTCDWRVNHPDGNVKWQRGSGNPTKLEDGSIIWDSIIIDITEEKIAKETLEATEKRFEQLFDKVTNLSVQGYSADGEVIFWNKASEELYGFTKEEALGQKLTELIIPHEMRPFVEKSVAEMIRTGQQHPADELELQRKDGTKVPVYSNHTILKLPGRPPELFCIDIDLRPQKRVEQNLKKSEEKYRDLFNVSPLPLWIYELDSLQLIDVNDTAQKHYGYSKDEFLKLTLKDFNSAEELSIIRKAHKEIVENNGTIHFGLFTHHKKNGEAIRVDVSGHLVQFENRHCIIAVCIDMTEREENIKTIEKINERYEYVHKATLDAIYDWDTIKDIFLWNDSFERIFGHNVEGKVFKLKDWIELTHPEDHAKNKEIWDEFVANPTQTKWVKKFQFRKADGTYAYVEEIGHMIRDEAGNPIRMIGSLRDQTKQKQDELQKKLLNEIGGLFNLEKGLKESLEIVLAHLVEFGEFSFAEAWIVSADKKRVTLLAKHIGDDSAKVFYEISADVTELSYGEGLPGAVWQNNNIEIWNHIDQKDEFIRKEAALEAGLKSVLGLPLTHNNKVIGVMVFGTNRLSNNLSYYKELFKELESTIGSELNRKKLEEELYLIFQNSPDILCIGGTNGKFVKVNPAFCELLGYTEHELTSQPFTDFVYIDDLASTQKEIKENVEGKPYVSNFVNRYIAKDGRLIWISWKSSPYHYEDGMSFAYGRDITEQKELQDLLDNAYKMARIGGWELNTINNKVYWSPITKQIHEVSDDFIPSLENGLSFYKDEYQEIMKSAIEKSISNGTPWDLELIIITAKGSELWVRCIGRAEFVNGICVRLIGSFQDINQRKSAEIDLRETNKQIQTTLESIQDGFFTLDQDFTVTYWNRLAEEMLHTPREQIIGKNLWEVFEDATSLPSYDYYHKALSEKVKVQFEDYYEPIKSWFEITAYPSPTGISVYFKNITEKKEAEIELIKFKNVIENSQDGIAMANKNGEAIYLNPSFVRMLDHTAESLEKAGGPMGVYADKKIAQEVFRNLLSKQNWKGDIELLDKNGNILNFYLSGGPIFDEQNELIAIYGIHTDISERIEAEKELKDLFTERNTILESIGDAFFALDKNWIVTYWNKQAEAVLARKREELVGNNLWDVFSDAIELEFYTQYHKAMNTGEMVTFEEYYPTANKWFEVSAYPSESGLSVYFKDVSIRKHAEEQIMQTNERFLKVTQATNDAIWDWDIQNGKLFRGDGFNTIFGLDVIDKNFVIEDYNTGIHPADYDRVTESINNALSDKSSLKWTQEYRYAKITGEYAFVVDRGIIIRDNKGKAIRMVGAMMDITKRKETEESLIQLNAELDIRAKELALSNAELEQFAFVASHDLQEPLRMITSFLSQLEKNYGNKLDARAEKYIYFAVDGAKRMRQIILDLLEFSRVGRKDGEIEKVDLNELIDEVISLQHQLINEKSARIIVNKLPTVHVHKARVQQVFQNLINNALKYTKEEVAPEIEISVIEDDLYWTFAIKDNGLGIEHEYFEKIFVIFQRLHAKDEFKGTGMGLSIVKKIIETLGGRIWLESEYGFGSTFFFTLKKQ